MTLSQLFARYKAENAAPLAYYIARRVFVRDTYAVPAFLHVAWIGGRR